MVMQKRGLASGLKTLSLIYLMSVSAFGVTIALKSDAPWALHVQAAVRFATPYVQSAAETVNEKAIQPSLAWLAETGQQARDYAENQVQQARDYAENQVKQVFAETPPPPKKVAAAEKPAAPQKKVVAVEKPVAPPQVAAAPSVPSAPPPAAKPEKEKVAALPPKPLEIAPPEPAPPP